MNFTLSVVEGTNPQMTINRCGYATFRDPNTGQTSFVRRLGNYFFPRFHLYINAIDEKGMHCSLHLDMKKPTYIRGHAHSGEYDGEQVTKEMERIRFIVVQTSSSP